MKISEWQGGGGRWYAANTSDLGTERSRWWYVPRLLGISLEDYVKMLVEKYQVCDININDNGFLFFAWDKYSYCHRYVLDMNKLLKNK